MRERLVHDPVQALQVVLPTSPFHHLVRACQYPWFSSMRTTSAVVETFSCCRTLLITFKDVIRLSVPRGGPPWLSFLHACYFFSFWPLKKDVTTVPSPGQRPIFGTPTSLATISISSDLRSRRLRSMLARARFGRALVNGLWPSPSSTRWLRSRRSPPRAPSPRQPHAPIRAPLLRPEEGPE